jgi:exonuclease 3'-5' domain-containing protein 1
MEKPEIHIIDMAEQIEQLIDRLAGPTYMSALYMDLEGVNLCRDGSISIIYILNVHTLGTLKFDTAGTVPGKTLRGVLQDEEVEKIYSSTPATIRTRCSPTTA